MQMYIKLLNFLNACQIHTVECVSKIKSTFLIIFHAIYEAVCIQLTHFSCDDCGNTCSLFCFHYQTLSMNHLSSFMIRSWNNGMRCRYLIFFWAFSVKLLSVECHKTWLMISQHWFGKWLGAVSRKPLPEPTMTWPRKVNAIIMFNMARAVLTHWGRDEMAAVFQMTFSNTFCWMKIYEFRLKFHKSLFPWVQLIILQHWFR